MTATVDAALSLWDLAGAPYALAANRENAVYRVDASDARYALRLHRVGYRSDGELHSELCWMAAAARGGLRVPAPVAARSGAMLQRVDGVQVDLLTWLPGQTMDSALANALPDQRRALFARLGRDMARLHAVSDAWTPPAGFTRAAWDLEGLLGDAPLWGRFWENPALDPDSRALLCAFRKRAQADLAALHATLDYGLIHADLVSPLLEWTAEPEVVVVLQALERRRDKSFGKESLALVLEEGVKDEVDTATLRHVLLEVAHDPEHVAL